MSTAHELMERLRTDGAQRFAATDLAADHSALRRKVARQRAARTAGVSVASVAAVGAAVFAGFQVLGNGDVVTPATDVPATPAEATPTAAPTTASAAITSVSVAKGERIEDVAAALAASYGVSQDQALAAITAALPAEAEGHAEGWVLAGDYGFEAGTDLQDAGAQLVSTTVKLLNSYDVPQDKWNDTVIIASIVQQEQLAGPTDQAGAARVLLNRLDRDWPLAVNSPLAYAAGIDIDDVTKDQRDNSDSPYNLYGHKGLPPTGIGAPTPEALDATIHPVDGDWMFFLTTPDGTVTLYDDYAVFAEAVKAQTKG